MPTVKVFNMPTVKVFSAGDHYHAEPEDASELINLILTKCGYTKEINWECRIDKMVTYTSDKPIHIIGFKPFGVTLLVKVKTNGNIGQRMTLLIPDESGYTAKRLFEQLHGVEKSINRNWRQKLHQEKLQEFQNVEKLQIPCVIKEEKLEEHQQMIIEEPMPELQENRPNFIDLKSICHDEEKLKYVLTKVKRVSESFTKSKKIFVKNLKEECGWEGHPTNACSRILTEIASKNYIMQVMENDNVIGFSLTSQGAKLIGIEIQQQSKVQNQQQPDFADFVKLLVEHQEKAQELADVSSKLTSNKIKREGFIIELAKLDNEDADLMKIICQNKETYQLIDNFMKVVSILQER